MKKPLLIILLVGNLIGSLQIQAAEVFLTASSKNADATPLTFGNLSDSLFLQLFEKKGPLGNFILQAGRSSQTDSTFEENTAGFVRVDTEDKRLYTFSKISPDKPIDEAQASRFQILFLTDYEVKLFKVRPTRANKLALAINRQTSTDAIANTAYDSATNIFEKALSTYSDASKETLSSDDSALLVGEFAKIIELITTGLPEQSANDKVKDLAGFDNFVSLFKEKVSTLIAELQKLTFDTKTAQIFLNAVKSWDFGYSTKVDAAPANGDTVIIRSMATGKYITTVKAKDSSGNDIFYLASSSDDLTGALQFKIQETGGRLGFSSLSKGSKDLIIKATPADVDAGLVDSTRKKLTRIMLSEKSQKQFGTTGTEDQQFQITGNKDGFYLECMAQKNSLSGFLRVDPTDTNFLRVYDSSGNPLVKDDSLSKFKLIVVSKHKTFFEGLFDSKTKTDPAQRLESFSNLVDQASTMENAQLLLEEINKFILENKTSDNGWTLFKRNFGLVANSLKDKFGTVFGATILETDAYKALDTTLSSAFSSAAAGIPASGDIVVIYSIAANQYLSTTKAKLPTGEDVIYLTTTAEDPISASQFKIQTTSDGLGFGFESLSQEAAGLVLQALPPVIQADSVESTRKQLTRIMLSQKPSMAFGQPGTEHGQFKLQQINASNIGDGFYLKSIGQSDATKGFLTVNQTADATFLRAFDNTGAPLAQTTGSGFKFVIISKSKTFFDALLKVRSETNPGTRLDLYATMIGSASSTENGIVLLNEIKRFVMENKKTATGWSDFKDNFGPKVEAIITSFNDTFSREIEATQTLKDAIKALDDALSSIFIEKLTSGFYALAWINSSGEKKFIKLVSEDDKHIEPDYTQQFKICAVGTDKLDPMGIFNVTVSNTEPSIQLETEYNKDAVLAGPNKKIEGDPNEASYSTTKVADNGISGAYLKIVGWRQNSNKNTPLTPEPQEQFEFSFEGSLDNMKLKSRSNAGYWTVDQTTFCIKSTGDDGRVLSSPSDNSSFALIPLSAPEVELAKVRGKSVIDQITFYSSRAKQITPKTTNTLREQFVTEVEKFFNVVLSSPDKYREAKTNSAKIDELIKYLIDQKTVSTYKTVLDRTLKVQNAWIAGFVGPVENDKWYVFSLSDPTLGNKIFKFEKSTDQTKDEYLLKTVDKVGKQDELDPASRVKATVGNDNVVIFTTLADNKVYTLSVTDNPAGKARTGIVAKVLSGAPTDNEKFLANTNDDSSISFKSLKADCGFITVDSAGLISTLSELTSEKAGLVGQAGELVATDQAKFQKTVLTDFHKDLSELRKITDDLTRLSRYLEKSIYKDITPAQIEALAGEVIFWTTKIMDEKDPAHYKTLSTNKAFSDKLNSLFAGVAKIIPAESPSKQLLADTQTRWSGGATNLLRNPIIPEDGKKIILSFTPQGGKTVYLRAAKDADSGNIILKADSEFSIEPANVLQVAIDGDKVGFKSPANQGAILFSKSLPAESTDWATKRKVIESALTFMPAEITKFKNKTPSGCQFVIPASATASSVSFQTVPYDNDDPTKRVLKGFMSFSGSVTGTIRVLSESTLQPIVATEDRLTANERFSLILVNDIFNQALELQKETDNEKIATALKTMIPLIKPNTVDKTFFMDALKKSFKDKRDIKISTYIKDIITKIKDEWALTDTAEDIVKIKEILKTTAPVGSNYVDVVKESLKTLLQTPIAQRQDFVENNIGSQIKDWNISLVEAWTDAIITTDLKLAATDANLVRKIILERINVINEFMDTLNKFIPFDKANKTGIREIKAAVTVKLNELKNQGRALGAASPTSTTTPATTTPATGAKSYR